VVQCGIPTNCWTPKIAAILRSRHGSWPSFYKHRSELIICIPLCEAAGGILVSYYHMVSSELSLRGGRVTQYGCSDVLACPGTLYHSLVNKKITDPRTTKPMPQLDEDIRSDIRFFAFYIGNGTLCFSAPDTDEFEYDTWLDHPNHI